MAVDIYKRKGCSYRNSNGTTFIFLKIVPDSISQFKLAKHKTSQVKPKLEKNKNKIHSQALYCGLFELNVNFGTLQFIDV